MMIRRRLFTTDAGNMKERERIAHCCKTNLLLLYSFFSLSKILKNTVAKYQFRIDGASLDEIDIANMMRKLARQSGSNIIPPLHLLEYSQTKQKWAIFMAVRIIDGPICTKKQIGYFQINSTVGTERPSAIWRTFVKINRGE